MPKIRFAVIGYGFIGRRHVDTLKSFDESDCVAVCDKDPERLKEVQAKYPDIDVYDNVDDLLTRSDVDTVIISANNNQHFSLTIKAARAGKNIICEKPAAMSVREFDQMMEEVYQAKVLFTVHQQRRFDKDYQTVKKCWDQKLVGDIYTIQSSLYGYNGNMHDWHVYKAEGGGMLFDWGVHLIDQAMYLVSGKLKSIFADVRNVINKEVDDYYHIMLCFENGVTFIIELGTYFLSDQKDWFERHWYVGGNKGSMYVDKFEPQGKIVRTAHLLENVSGEQDKSAKTYGPTRSFGVPAPGLILTEDLPKVNCEQRDYFVNYFKARRGEEEFLVKTDEVRRVLQVMEAVRKSATTKRSVDFDY